MSMTTHTPTPAGAIDGPQSQVLADGSLAALVTLRRDGRSQISDITYHFDPAARLVRISATEDRAKVTNLRRDPRAALHVRVPSGYGFVVAEGLARITPPAAAPDDETVEALVEQYRAIRGEHPDWEEFRAVMVSDRRVLISIPIERAYGFLP